MVAALEPRSTKSLAAHAACANLQGAAAHAVLTGEERGLLRRANRPAPELEAIIGYFVNPVALRTQLEGGLTFREALQRVRDTVVGAQANAEVTLPLS